MPPQMPLNPVAALLEKLRAEQRNPTEQEKAFIATELAKANAPAAAIGAPPAGAPAPAADQYQATKDIISQQLSPSVVSSPVRQTVSTLVDPIWKALQMADPTAAQQQMQQGQNALASLDAWQMSDTPISVPVPSSQGYRAGSDILQGAMGAATAPIALTNPLAAAVSIPMTMAGDRFQEAATHDLGLDPDKTRFAYDLANALLMGHGAATGLTAEPRLGKPPVNNLNMREVQKVARRGGGSFDVASGKRVMDATAASALGRADSEMVGTKPFSIGELSTFVENHQKELLKPNRVLGVFPSHESGKYFAEVSRTYRGPDAKFRAMRDALWAPQPQESVFYHNPESGPEFPSVPRPGGEGSAELTALRPGHVLEDALYNFNKNDKGEIDLGRMVDKDFTVQQSQSGEFSAVNPDTGNTVSIKQGSGKASTGQPKRSDILPVDINPSYVDKLKSVGVEEFKQMPTQSFEQTFKVGSDGMLEVQEPIKNRLKLLYDYGKNVVKANWDQNKPIFDLANDITSHDPAAVASRSFAALSPQVSVAQNLHDMLKVFNRIKMSGKDASKLSANEMNAMAKDVGNPSSKVPNLMRAFTDQPLSSYGKEPFSPIGKVEHLAEGMKTGERGIPFDLWMQRVLGLSADTPPSNAMGYEAMYRAVAGVAKELNTTPFEMMHQIWSAARTIHGSETIGPTQMLDVAGIDKVPGTRGFERSLDRGAILEIPQMQAQQRKGMLWDIKGNLLGNGTDIRSLALPIGAATAYMLMDDEKKKGGAGLLMGALAPTRVRSIMADFKTTTHGVHSPAHYTAVEKMLQQPSAVELDAMAPYPLSGSGGKGEPKFILPTGDIIGGDPNLTHMRFAGENGGFEKVMEAGAHRISYDKAHEHTGQGIETWSPFTSRAADSIANMHEVAAFAVKPFGPEHVSTVVDVHKPAAAGANPRYRFTDYLGSKEIYDLNADKLRAFADGLFAKAKAAATKK